MRAIAAGKKTLAEHRTEERERKRKSRANQKANSGTVPEKPEDALSGPNGDERLVEDAPLAPEHTPPAAKPRSRGATGDQSLLDFSARVRELVRTTSNKKAERFVKTSVSAEELAYVGKILTDIANLKKSRAVRPTSPSLENDVPSSLAPMDVEQPALEAAVAVRA